MSKMMSKVILLQLILCVVSQHLTVENGMYTNIVVEIKEDVVPSVDCTDFLEKLEIFFKSSSERLYWAFFDKLSYGSFTIILPTQWDCKNKAIENYDGGSIAVTIADTKQKIYTQQLNEECGHQGEQIFIDKETVMNQDLTAESFNLEWLKFRYGIFDTNEYVEPIYFPCIASNNSNFPMCNEAHNIGLSENEPESDSTLKRLFPDFNRYQPNKHNAYCKKNPVEIIFNHEDFQSQQKFEHKAPSFRYVKKLLTRYMIIVDDTSSISSERDSFSFLHDALRKFIEKDLDRDHTEVGIHVLSENSSNINTNMIKPLISSENREGILGNFWYTEYKYVNIPKCELFEALSQSINSLSDRSMTYGQGENIIFVIGPGMNKCSDDKIDNIVNAANHKNIKIVTLNYPAIASGRIPFDVGGFADKTKGKSFTVLEQKQNEQQSLFSTFFDLANTLLFLSNSYASIPRSLPVEIYRKELFDSGSTRNDDRGIVMDSFHLDSSFSAFNFFVYIYDRRERNIEKGMKLISPTNIQYSTLRELRAEYHQLEILGNFTANGSWTYFLKRFYGYPQPNFVQVLANPKNQNFISMKLKVKKLSTKGTFEIYVEIKKGYNPVIDARVTAVQTSPEGTITFELFDITKSSGVYRKLIVPPTHGTFKIEVFANDNGNTAYIAEGSHQNHSKQPVSSFQRYLIPVTLFVDSKDVDYDKSYLKTIGKIFDLKAVDISSSKLIIEFTEPDYGVKSNHLQIVYDVRFSFYFKDVLDNFDTMTNKLILNNTIQTNNYGMVQSISINLSQELMLMNRIIYIALRPIVEQTNGPISNIVRAVIPKNDVVSPSENSSEEPVDWNQSEEVVDDNLNLSGFVIPIIVFGILLLLSICCCVFYCCSKKKSSNKNQKQKDYNGMVWHSQINTVKVPTPVHSSGYSEYDRNSVLNTSYPDQYHTVGIPLPTNEQIREDPLCYDDAMHNLKCEQPFDCCDGDISKVLDRTEPVWASYLLSEYAKKQNLLGIDRNGILYDESEKGSYHEHIGLPVVDNYNPNDFGYYQSSLSMPFGSLQSVDNNERKIRNITMV